MAKVGQILLLVGAIMSVFGAVIMLVFGAIFQNLPNDVPRLEVWLAGFYYVWGALALVGAIFAFIGWSKARNGELKGAFIFGLIGSLLPPVQLITLIGAILIKVAPPEQKYA